jgi:hypothetical protein
MCCSDNTKIQYSLLDTRPEGQQIESQSRLIFILLTCKYTVTWYGVTIDGGFELGIGFIGHLYTQLVKYK